MIKLEVEDYCQDCPEFEPAYSHIRYLNTGKCDTFVECEHKSRCRNINTYLYQQIAKEQIRCKDCGHNANPPEAGNAACDLFYGMTDQYGFCHKAERRD